MPTLTADDGATIGYRILGEGEPLFVVPGGPARDADYLGDLAGLPTAVGRSVVILEPRGTGASADVKRRTCTAETIGGDLEALRRHLGVETIDLLAHSAGCAVVYLFAVAHPTHLRRLVLLNPSTTMLGFAPTDAERTRQAELRRGQPWYEGARSALDLSASIGWTDEIGRATAPFSYACWTPEAQAHSSATSRDRGLAATFWRGPTDRPALRAALADVATPTHVVVGALDLTPGPTTGARIANFFGDGSAHALERAAHFPWIDDPTAFTTLMGQLLDDRS